MGLYVCPSGLELEIRGLKGKELRFLEGKKGIRSIGKILSTCIVSVGATGPYDDLDPDKPVDTDKLLVGDETFALLAVRAETFGAAYDFNFQCGSCGERVAWTVDIIKDLPLKKLAPEDAERFRSKEPFVGVLSNGDVIKFRLPTGADKRAASPSKNASDSILVNIVRRLIEVISADGATQNPKKYVEESGLKIVMEIGKKLQANDCGVDTTIEVECTCEEVQKLQLPLGQSFWAAAPA